MKKIFLASLIVILLSATALSAGQLHPKFKLTFTERLRFLAWDNAITLDETAQAAQSFTRHRTCLIGQWTPQPHLELTLKLANEFRYYFAPENREFTFNEVFVDFLYVKWRRDRFLPGTLTVGRQNIILGEGFLVMDGHPLDGSRGIYFNALRYDWDIKSDLRLTGFYSYMPSVDDWLPLINDQEQKLVEQDEEGLGLYFTGKINKVNLETYYLRKNVKKAGKLASEASTINALGSRLSLPLTNKFAYAVEAAYQFGEKGELDRSAFGGHMHFDYIFKHDREIFYLPVKASLGGIYLSGNAAGDDDTWGGWDPMFARWPKWSESYIYTQINEDLVAYWTNLASLFGKVGFKLTPSMNFDLDYHHLMATEKPPDNSLFPGGDGKTRGNLFIGMLTYKFDQRWSGHVLWEIFAPGDYYFEGADSYSWLRTELMLTL
ncbi:MAG: alginate export family protein [Candidatus Zixiibacteriota bacterium]